MNALIQELVTKAELNDEQANKVATVVREFLIGRLPDVLRGPVESVLTGNRVDDAVDAAKSMLGSFLK